LHRVVTVTPNAAVDWTCFVAALRPRARQEARTAGRQAGGKGVNVSRVLAALGVPVRSVVVVGGAAGAEIVRDLEAARLEPVAVEAAGESRTCLEIVEERRGAATQLHGRGVDADAATARALVAAVAEALDGAAWLALCGSLPPGLPTDAYATLIGVARTRGVRVALDASGDALVAAWHARPDLLRINRDEAAALPRNAAAGSPFGAVSDGPRAIAAWEPGRAWRVAPPRVRARNPIGCGDAMLAGLLARIDTGPFDEALRFAAALAGAEAASPVAGRPDLAVAAGLLAGVELRAETPEVGA
jgi:fructose-1-phosphate kinase PfkB-like protein